MTKLSDLELEKRIAEIEGVTVEVTDCGGYLIIAAKIDRYFWKFYKPLADKAMLWDSRLKYKVEIDDDCKTCRIWVIPGGDCFVVDYETDEDLPRAMLEVIVESKRNA